MTLRIPILLTICALIQGCSLLTPPTSMATPEPTTTDQSYWLSTPPRIAIATAYAPEMAALLPKLENRTEHRINGVSFWTGVINDQDIVLFMTGVSMVNAAMNTQLLLDHFNISVIMVSGIAGGLDPDLSIGDVTIPAKWGQYNETLYMRETAPGEYAPHPGYEPRFPSFDFIAPQGVRIASAADPKPERRYWFEANSDLIDLAASATQSLSLNRCTDAGACLPRKPEVIIGGAGVSGSVFMDNARFRDYLHAAFSAQVVEMETAAIAMVSHANAVPYIAFRSLSDLAGGGQADKNEMEAFEALAAENASIVLLAFLDAYGAEMSNKAAAATSSLPTTNSPVALQSCEINFSNIPLIAENAFGKTRASKLGELQMDPAKERAFMDSLDALTRQTLAAATAHTEFDEHINIENVWGGYLGGTSPSLSAQFNIKSPDDRNTAAIAAAALGYVFMQDSVLVQCTAYAHEKDASPVFELIETGETDALSTDTIRSIYGMMMGQADGELRLGYSYYPAEDRFSVLGFLDGGAVERMAVTETYHDLKHLTGDATSISLHETRRWTTFPSNDWNTFTDGSQYFDGELPDKMRTSLAPLQAAFLDAVDALPAPE